MALSHSYPTSSATNSLSSSAVRALQLELKSLQSEPVEGFTVNCEDESLFKWTVGIFGPPGTLYQVCYF